MNDHPTLSIITVNLNNREGLQRTIDSVVGQTFTDYEWIVIDGGSTDGSRELIEQYQDHFAYWCSEPDKGIYNAMNKGIAHARGDWLQFLNSGDWLYENTTLEKVFSHKYEADVIYGDFCNHTHQGEQYIQEYEEISSFSFYSHNICHQSIFYTRKIFNKIKFDESFNIISDWILNFRLTLYGYRFSHIPVTIVKIALGGISSNKELIDEELKIFRTKIIPYHLLKDYEILIKIRQINNRKSTSHIYKSSIKFCNWLNSFLLKIENKRCKLLHII